MSVSVAVGRDHYPVTLSPLRTALGHDYNFKEISRPFSLLRNIFRWH